LKALEVESDSFGTMLEPVLMNKLPPDVRLIVSRKTGGSGIKIDELLKHIEEELAARERRAHNTTPPPTQQQERGKARATTLLADTSRSTTPSCCYCQQNHPSRECTTVTSVAARNRSSGTLADVSVLPEDTCVDSVFF
jgi:hypothetical protein